jgi:ribosomal protein S18 acetylase RimI-like enzyme
MIRYAENRPLDPRAIAILYIAAGVENAITSHEQIQKMYENSNLVISAWDGSRLVGVARALTDLAYCCYLSDLAVDKKYQGLGIGSSLLTLIQKSIGVNGSLILLSSPQASNFYERLGFRRLTNGYIGKGIL